MTDCTSNSLQTHVASCTHCPEPIRASLAYLGHRSILQKAELRGCWKKAFFKKVWDRLHIERKWVSTYEKEGSSAGRGSHYDAHDGSYSPEGNAKDGNEDGDSDSEKEELGENMNALIKAAAIWLTEQDAATDQARSTSRSAKATKALPTSKNGNGNSPGPTRRGDTSLPTKRRRVHF